jgi:hypothetical protein
MISAAWRHAKMVVALGGGNRAPPIDDWEHRHIELHEFLAACSSAFPESCSNLPARLRWSPAEERQRANDLQPNLPPLALRQWPDENALVRLDPIRMIMREILQEIHRPLNDERVGVVGECGDLGEQRRVVLDLVACAIRLCDVAAIAAGEQRADRARGAGAASPLRASALRLSQRRVTPLDGDVRLQSRRTLGVPRTRATSAA